MKDNYPSPAWHWLCVCQHSCSKRNLWCMYDLVKARLFSHLTLVVFMVVLLDYFGKTFIWMSWFIQLIFLISFPVSVEKSPSSPCGFCACCTPAACIFHKLGCSEASTFWKSWRATGALQQCFFDHKHEWQVSSRHPTTGLKPSDPLVDQVSWEYSFYFNMAQVKVTQTYTKTGAHSTVNTFWAAFVMYVCGIPTSQTLENVTISWW